MTTSVEKIEIFSPYQKKLTLVFGESDTGFHVREIDGLDPTKSNIVTSTFAQQAGVQRQTSRREPRTLKIKLGFDIWYGPVTVEVLRQQLYDFFMTQMNVTCRFYLGSGLVVDVRGEVEDFVSPRSVEDPEATISIFCFDPDFTASAPLFLGETGAGNTTATLKYAGSVPAGFRFSMFAERDLPGFELKITPDDRRQRVMTFDLPTPAGTVLEFSTIPNEKGAWHIKNGVRTSVLQGVLGNSVWPELHPGDNQVRVTMGGASNPFRIAYTSRYGGI